MLHHGNSARNVSNFLGITYSQSDDPILRGTETLLLFHTPKELSSGYANVNRAYQNGSLMAEALGVSQFFTGFLCTTIKEDKTGSIKNYLGYPRFG